MIGKNNYIQWILFTFFFISWESGFSNISFLPQDTLNAETTKHANVIDDFFEEQSKDSSWIFFFQEEGKIVVEMDSITKSKSLEAYQGYLNNKIMNYQHSQQVFKWQLTSSKLIFITVIILVMAGILFSGLQFKKGTSDSKTELEFSRDGMKVSSSILGVIILVLSLVFFYLYLVYVYPIHEVF